MAKECWYCLMAITSGNYIQHTIYKKGKKKNTVYYCSKQCLIYQVEEMNEKRHTK